MHDVKIIKINGNAKKEEGVVFSGERADSNRHIHDSQSCALPLSYNHHFLMPCCDSNADTQNQSLR